MYISEDIKKYESLIMSQVYKYAYENYNLEPLLEIRDIEWTGTVFYVSNMDKELHSDIIDDLKSIGSYYWIKENCATFVILPDVFSQRDYPYNTERNQYDIDRPNVVIINGFVFELLVNSDKDYLIYNHNGKSYLFYSVRSQLNSVINSKYNTNYNVEKLDITNKLQVLYTYDCSFMYDRIMSNPTYLDSDNVKFININVENRIIEPNSQQLSVAVGLVSPYLLFDYENKVDSKVFVNVPGLLGISRDAWVMEHIFNDDSNTVYIHDENMLFSNTCLIIYKDGTYHIDNTYTVDSGKVMTKIDKHTVCLQKDENVSKIYVFTRPFMYDSDYVRVDSIYKQAMNKNERAYTIMKPYAQYTNELFRMMTWDNPSLDDIIDYGYKYDLDVLKSIQSLFPRYMNLDKDSWDICKDVPKITKSYTIVNYGEDDEFDSWVDYANKEFIDRSRPGHWASSERYPNIPYYKTDPRQVWIYDDVLAFDWDEDDEGTMNFLTSKFIAVVPNRLSLYPCLFINHKMVQSDYNIYHFGIDASVIVMDTEEILRDYVKSTTINELTVGVNWDDFNTKDDSRTYTESTSDVYNLSGDIRKIVIYDDQSIMEKVDFSHPHIRSLLKDVDRVKTIVNSTISSVEIVFTEYVLSNYVEEPGPIWYEEVKDPDWNPTYDAVDRGTNWDVLGEHDKERDGFADTSDNYPGIVEIVGFASTTPRYSNADRLVTWADKLLGDYVDPDRPGHWDMSANYANIPDGDINPRDIWIYDDVKNDPRNIYIYAQPTVEVAVHPFSKEYYTLQPGRIMKDPLYRHELIWDTYGGDKDKSQYITTQFVNGCLNADTFTLDGDGVPYSPYLFRYLDGIELFDFEVGQSFVVSATSNKRDVYTIDSPLYDDVYSIFADVREPNLLINRTTTKLKGITKVYLPEKEVVTLKKDKIQNAPTFTSKLRENATLFFDKYGILCNSYLTVISDHVVDIEKMYNYGTNSELTDDVVINTYLLQYVNKRYYTDLEIDESRISAEFNKGTFNERCIKDEYIIKLFEHDGQFATHEAPVETKSYDTFIGEKILTKYYLSCMGNIYSGSKLRFTTEVSPLTGNFINTDGTLGNIPLTNLDFVSKRKEYDDQTLPLNTRYVFENYIYWDLYMNYTGDVDKPYVLPNVYIDVTDTHSITVNKPKVEYYGNLSDALCAWTSIDTLPNDIY